MAARSLALAGTPAPVAATDRRVSYTAAEILASLRTELVVRRVAWSDPGVKLVPPDRVIVTGKVQGSAGPSPAQVTLQIGVSHDGRPSVASTKLSGAAADVRNALLDALTKRVEEANRALPGQPGPVQTARRILVENGRTVVIDVSSQSTTGTASGPSASEGPYPTPTLRPPHPPTRGPAIIPRPMPPTTRDRDVIVGGFLHPDSVTPVPPSR